MHTATPAELVERAKSEYWEMPGLSLTAKQAARLWNIPLVTAEHVLGSLVGLGFLARREPGIFILAAGSPLASRARAYAARSL